jgi:hypothetical protein
MDLTGRAEDIAMDANEQTRKIDLVIENIEMLKLSTSSLDSKVHNTSSALMEHIEAKAVEAINKTLGSHEALAIMMGNSSGALREALLNRINQNNEKLALLEVDVKRAAQELKENNIEINNKFDMLSDNLNENTDAVYNYINASSSSFQNLSNGLDGLLVSEVSIFTEAQHSRKVVDRLSNSTSNNFQDVMNSMNVTMIGVGNLEKIATKLVVETNSTKQDILTKIEKLPSEIAKIQRKKTCPTGWTAHLSMCIKHFSGPRTFADAHSKCAQEGGHLPYVKSQATNAFISGQAPGSKWLGLTDSGRYLLLSVKLISFMSCYFSDCNKVHA